MNRSKLICIISIAVAAVVSVLSGLGIYALCLFMPTESDGAFCELKAGRYVSADDCAAIFGTSEVEIEISIQDRSQISGEDALVFISDSSLITVIIKGNKSDVRVTYYQSESGNFGFELFGAAVNKKYNCTIKNVNSMEVYAGDNSALQATFVWEREL